MPSLDVAPPIVLGVLGGIASGKSWVARALAGPHGMVLDADQAAHRALQDPEIQAKIAERFGSEAIGEDGQTDRAVLAKVVFADPGARADLEGWIHPAVRATLSAALEDAERRAVPRVVLDVPLLLENADVHGLLARCHLLVFVDAPLEDRDRRAVHDRGWTPGEVARREAAQMPLAQKRAHAHVVIDNRGDLKTLEANVQDVLARLPKAHAPTAKPRPPRNQD